MVSININNLTEGERIVLSYILKGYTVKEIAEKEDMSVQRVYKQIILLKKRGYKFW